MKLNKGEWSEVYVFLKLLAEGKLYAADKDLKKIEFYLNFAKYKKWVELRSKNNAFNLQDTLGMNV